MLRIVTHIERLLLVNDCVIVPKFGGFVLRTVSAVCSVEDHSFHPLRKEFVFNTTLQHGDGLLSESYMQLYEVSYRKAQLMLEEDVDDLKSSLLQYKKISLGLLGSFTQGDEGQVIFHPGEAGLFSVQSYGLPVFYFPVLEPIQLEREEVALLTGKKRDTFYIPISRKLLRTVAASAAAVALFLLVSTPVKDVNQAAYTASFVPSEMVSHKVVPGKFIEEVVLEEATGQEVKEEKIVEKITAQPSVVSTKAESKPEVAERKEVKSSKMYHIVIASFPTVAQADEYMAGVNRDECKHVSKVERGGKYRIYADRFDNREQAEAYMATLRTNNKYKDAWLFISR